MKDLRQPGTLTLPTFADYAYIKAKAASLPGLVLYRRPKHCRLRRGLSKATLGPSGAAARRRHCSTVSRLLSTESLITRVMFAVKDQFAGGRPRPSIKMPGKRLMFPFSGPNIFRKKSITLSSVKERSKFSSRSADQVLGERLVHPLHLETLQPR